MKKAFLIAVTILLFTACKKNNNGVDPVDSEHYPQTWILTIDEAPDKYIFLKANVPVMLGAGSAFTTTTAEVEAEHPLTLVTVTV